MCRLVLAALACGFALGVVGDSARLHAATCTPSGKGKCYACSSCRYCGNCAKRGGTCSVCKRAHTGGEPAGFHD